MGTPAHAFKHRSDNKIYRIQNPQCPLVSTKAYRDYGMDEYPQGTNAVVAVIAYTGYDMEDAMIINKGAFERGFGFGCVVKTMVVDLDDEEKSSSEGGCRPDFVFSNIKRPPLTLDEIGMVGEKFYAGKRMEERKKEGRTEENLVILIHSFTHSLTLYSLTHSVLTHSPFIFSFSFHNIFLLKQYQKSPPLSLPPPLYRPRFRWFTLRR